MSTAICHIEPSLVDVSAAVARCEPDSAELRTWRHMGGCRHGFTLIELLVVISIIAVLIAILLPTLTKAKRHVQVISCMSNLRQIAIGLSTYVTDNNGQYPVPTCFNGNWVFLSGNSPVDNRRNLVEMAGSVPGMWFCPLYPWAGPQGNLNDNEWTDHFFYPVDANPPSTGYFLFFLLQDTNYGHEGAGFSWDWRNSGNPDSDNRPMGAGPYTPGDADAAILADNNGAHVPTAESNSQRHPFGSGHSEVGFEETSVLYGDGHAISRSRTENWVVRSGGATTGY